MEIHQDQEMRPQALAQGRDRRREPRYPANFPIGLHLDHARVCTAWLVDVSAHGCCIQGSDLDIRVGWLITIGPTGWPSGDQPHLEATVRWLRTGAAGLEFLHPVPVHSPFWLRLIANGADN